MGGTKTKDTMAYMKTPLEQASPMKAEETFSQAYRKNRNAGENTFTYNGRSFTTESKSEKEKRGGEGEYKNKRTKVKAKEKEKIVISPKNDNPQENLNESIKEKETKKVKVLTKDQLKDNQKKSEIDENAKVREAKDTKSKTEKGTVERADAKVEVSKAKGEDLAGADGGKKAKLFGNARRYLNKKKTQILETKAAKKKKKQVLNPKF